MIAVSAIRRHWILRLSLKIYKSGINNTIILFSANKIPGIMFMSNIISKRVVLGLLATIAKTKLEINGTIKRKIPNRIFPTFLFWRPSLNKSTPNIKINPMSKSRKILFTRTT